MSRGVGAELARSTRGNRAYRVRGDADAHVGVTLVFYTQCVDVAKDVVDRRVAEAPLRGLGGSPGPGAVVRDAEQRDAQPFLLGRPDDRVAHDGAVVVGRAVRLVVDVVELADGADARKAQLAERDAADPLDEVGLQRGGDAVHRASPGPEIVVIGASRGRAPREASARRRAFHAERRASGPS